MPTVNISILPCIKGRIDRLRELITVNNRLMPHSIVAATGCKRSEAIALLLLLHGDRLANGYILIYHDTHPDVPFERRRFVEGLPDENEKIICQECEEVLEESDLLYDFEFHVISDIEFVVDVELAGE